MRSPWFAKKKPKTQFLNAPVVMTKILDLNLDRAFRTSLAEQIWLGITGAAPAAARP